MTRKGAIALLLSLVALLCGCYDPQPEPTDTAKEAEEKLDRIIKANYIFETELNGHLYVIARGRHAYAGVGILHSPNCPCLNGAEK